MANVFKRLRALMAAGVFILLPTTVLLLVLAKGYSMIHPVMLKLALALGFDSLIGGRFVVIMGILLLFLLAGSLVGLTKGVGSKWLERNILHFIPGYAYIRMRLDDMLAAESGKQHEAVVARFDDGSVPGMLIERGADGRCVVFLPDVPQGNSGALFIMDPDRVTVLDVPYHTLNDSMRNYGKGLLALEAMKKAS
jgi:uncharacterized membrane protein